MNESDSKERISAFVDGELRGSARDGVVEALYGSAELRRAWERFHLIGDALRKVGPVPGAGSTSKTVGAKPSAERILPARPRRPLLVPLPGLALAASIAAVAILGVRSLDHGVDASRHRVEAASTMPSDPGAPAPQLASTATQRDRPDVASSHGRDAAPAVDARLNAYLVNHNELAHHGVRGVLPYVRLVSYRPAAGDYR